MPRELAAARTASAARGLILPAGMRGSASLAFDGVDDRVVGTHGLALGAPAFTMEGWVCVRRQQVANQVLCILGPSATHTSIWLGTYNKRWEIGVYGIVDLMAPTEHVVGEWVHLAATHPGGTGTARLYVNGVQAASGSATPNITTTVAALGATNTGTLPAMAPLSGWRIYAAELTPTQIAARKRGEEIAGLSPVRWWKLEDGPGTTAHEEVGNTDDAVTGAVPSANVPFRPSRIVEDVPAAMLGTGAVSCTVAHHADLDPAAASWSLTLWTSARGVSGDIVAQKDNGTTGWILDFTTSGALRLRLRDGVTTITVTGTSQLGSLWSGSAGWHSVEITCDRAGGYAYLSVDGGPPARTALGALGSVANVAALIFGAAASGLLGGLNDAWWWNGRALTWDERRGLFFDGIVPAAGAATRIGWAMREGAGSVVASAPAGYNGTLSAASWTPATRCKAGILAP